MVTGTHVEHVETIPKNMLTQGTVVSPECLRKETMCTSVLNELLHGIPYGDPRRIKLQMYICKSIPVQTEHSPGDKYQGYVFVLPR